MLYVCVYMCSGVPTSIPGGTVKQLEFIAKSIHGSFNILESSLKGSVKHPVIGRELYLSASANAIFLHSHMG